MSIIKNTNIKEIKIIINNILIGIDQLDEFGYAYHPSEFNDKYRQKSDEIISYLKDVEKIIDELNEESVKNFEY